MKKIELTMSVFAALLMVSAVANAEDQYPAANFEPKVVFQDESAGSGSSSSTSSSSSSSSSSTSSSSDSDYPAANFQPKVVFEDKDYKHQETLSNSSSSADYSSGAGSSTSSSGAAVQKDESSAGYVLGLIVLGIAGFVLFKKGLVGSAQTSKSAGAANTSGLTGVARYLLKTSGTGVSRYLEKHAASAPAAKTGVAKYLASKGEPSGSTSGGRPATGVEKYMRNKG